MTIEELFGTLQMSVVATWRKHLRSAKYGKHMALDEFYKEMPEKVDDLIEAWMGAHSKKVGAFQNTLSSSNMNTLKYLNELKRVCKEGYDLLGDNDELKSLMDDIVNLINSTLYKVKELSESEIMDLKDFINEALNENQCFTCDKQTVKNALDELNDEGSDIKIIQDILDNNCKDLDKIYKKYEKLLVKFSILLNPNHGKHLDVENIINTAAKAWNN